MRIEKDPSGHVRRMVMEHKGDLHPQVVLEDESGKILDFYYMPEKAYIEVDVVARLDQAIYTSRIDGNRYGPGARFQGCSQKPAVVLLQQIVRIKRLAICEIALGKSAGELAL